MAFGDQSPELPPSYTGMYNFKANLSSFCKNEKNYRVRRRQPLDASSPALTPATVQHTGRKPHTFVEEFV